MKRKAGRRLFFAVAACLLSSPGAFATLCDIGDFKTHIAQAGECQLGIEGISDPKDKEAFKKCVNGYTAAKNCSAGKKVEPQMLEAIKTAWQESHPKPVQPEPKPGGEEPAQPPGPGQESYAPAKPDTEPHPSPQPKPGGQSGEKPETPESIIEKIKNGKFSSWTTEQLLDKLRKDGFLKEQLAVVEKFISASMEAAPATPRLPQVPGSEDSASRSGGGINLDGRKLDRQSAEARLGFDSGMARAASLIASGRPSSGRADAAPADRPSGTQRANILLIQTRPETLAANALSRFELRDFAGALKAASNALRLRPGDASALLIRAESFIRLGNYRKAAEDASALITLEPGNPGAYATRSLARYFSGDFKSALADIGRALSLSPAQASWWYRKAAIEFKLGDSQSMRASLKKAAALDPAYRFASDKAAARDGTQGLEFIFFGREFPAEKGPAAKARAKRGLYPLAIFAAIFACLTVPAGAWLLLSRSRRAPGELKASFSRGELIKGNYKIERLMAVGGMGEVYEARDLILDRTIALKAIRRDRNAKSEYLKRMLSEAQIAASLKHPNIVSIYTAFSENGMLCLVFEFVSGKTLKKLLEEKKTIAPAETVRVMSAVCEGLGDAHRHGIIHRDLKPSNIMLLPGGQVKILDFGIARRPSDNGQTYSGSPGYMAPEQSRGHSEKASDIFALGVCLYEMLTGVLPAACGKNSAPQTPAELRPDIPRALSELVMECISFRQEERPDSLPKIKSRLEKAVF